MNLTVSAILFRSTGDPDYADFWLRLEHVSEVNWEVPVTKEELQKLKPWLPKQLKERVPE
jgi:hypothetical protein